MINSEKQGFKHLAYISGPLLLYTLLYTLAVLGLEELLGDHIYKLSAQLGSVFGLAVAFFLGFRMNSAYDRWWEARKILGELTNTVKSFTAKLSCYYGNTKNLSPSQETIDSAPIYKLLRAYINQLQAELVLSDTENQDEELKELINTSALTSNQKLSNELLLAITLKIESDFASTANIEKSDLMQHINRFYDVQGKAERIKNTPFLLIYGAFTRLIVVVYVLLMPLFIGDIDIGGEDSLLEFLAIPIMIVVSSAFLTINKLANLTAEPFSKNATSFNSTFIFSSLEEHCRTMAMKIRS